MKLRTVGVEEEFLLIDSAARSRPMAEQVVAGTGGHASARDRSAAEGIEHELHQEQAETGTRVRILLDELRADLVNRRLTLAESAREQGVQIAALGTSPMPVDPTVTNDPRYEKMMSTYAAIAKQQLTCGCHVHVGIDSRAQGVTVLNAIQPWLSVILALSANSPFWQGEDTGYASYRRMVWDRWPAAGPTAAFVNEQDYDNTVQALVRSKVLLDQGMVYFDARLSARYPTLEVRVADVCTDPDDAVLVAALCRALVDSAAAADSGEWPSARIEVLRGAAWRAARSGLEGDLVDPVSGRAVRAEHRLQQLLHRVTPALKRHGDLDRVETSLHRLLSVGTGASHQRAHYRRHQQIRDVALDAAARTVPAALG
jgi:carboxylate-amine ligase